MTHTADNGGPAFPSEQGFDPDGHWNQSYDPGMTLRDYFAARALQSIMLDHDARAAFPQTIAGRAYDYADAMLAARKGGAA